MCVPENLMQSVKNLRSLSFIRKNLWLLSMWSNLENALLRKHIHEPIKTPIFVCGLARSGTTILTQILNEHIDTGSILYKDLPFIEIPYLWSKCSGLYYGKDISQTRLHKDGLHISQSSPDAFEELVWKKHIHRYKDGGFCKLISAADDLLGITQELPVVINKILYTRGKKSRYLSKGNYNIFRIEYLLNLFPDAKIIICVRDPFQQAMSLARVHKHFVDLSKKYPFLPSQLAELGHLEFGPQRKPIILPNGKSDETMDHWSKQEDYEGYLLQWKDVYSTVNRQFASNPNIFWFRHEEFLENPSEYLRNVLKWAGLSEEGIDMQSIDSRVQINNKYQTPSTVYDDEISSFYSSHMRNETIPVSDL